MDASPTIGSLRPSPTSKCKRGSLLNLLRHSLTHVAAKSPPINNMQGSRKNCVQRPWPGAISKIRPFKKGKMRGYKQPAHCACGEPHASDHSSPAHPQSYDASQTLLFSASVGMRLSTREKAFCQTAPEGVPDLAKRETSRAVTAPTLPRYTSAHHRLKPARWALPAAIAPVSYNSHGRNPSTAAFLLIRTFKNDRR